MTETTPKQRRATEAQIAAMCYTAIRAYVPEGATLDTWEQLQETERNRLVDVIHDRIVHLSSGNRLPSAAARDHGTEFNLGLSAYLIDVLCTGLYDYTMARARSSAVLTADGENEAEFTFFMGGHD